MEEKQNADKLVAMQMTPATKPHLFFHCWVHENRVFATEVPWPQALPAQYPVSQKQDDQVGPRPAVVPDNRTISVSELPAGSSSYI